ncbi:MAG: hypothetical protein MI892_15400 [Desulfobacterales bacterium]|nr:hypothetical protein [Desulfobacterales bacterium]
MLSKKAKYAVQVTLMIFVFGVVLGALIYNYIGDRKVEVRKEQAEQVEKEKKRVEFVVKIEDHYIQLKEYYKAKDYDKAVEVIMLFVEYGEADYKDLTEMKEEIRKYYLKKKFDFIPKIDLNAYLPQQKEKEEKIEQDDSLEVFIQSPRYDQYFYPFDFPLRFEAIALSSEGDYSDDIVWTSSIDGVIGKGKLLFVRLSIGDHTITATSTDGVRTGKMETLIHMLEDPRPIGMRNKAIN